MKAGVTLLLALSAAASAQAETPMGEAYARAARVLDANLIGAIRNAYVTPHWIGEGDRF
ncbi:hypothetical protein SmB9_26830 [Sphingosinicella microcystinivorans]|uniref:Uncharacterized protein n=1 Tax=Sphingosinicella microcystinivorans TaxID=335406 RepID=A0AAD1D7L7_SPHMI|nr:hypothetical protein [Sphingosinicella microcystinivorans]BBE35025.1 hypothetical protein SmB9_26830 [Sphingosinicella microcystinivorans]